MIYLVLSIFGLVIDKTSDANFVPFKLRGRLAALRPRRRDDRARGRTQS